MGFKQFVSIREDVLDPGFDEKLAPEIDEVIYGTAPSIYRDPREFFERTYLTNTIKTILLEIGRVLTGKGGHKIYPILAFFGGGKTHTLLTIYHAVLNPQYTRSLSEEIYELYRRIKGVEIIVIYGKDSRLAPSPIKPLRRGTRRIKTLWGYIGDRLGRYDLIAEDDELETCPDSGTIKELLRSRKAVILVDEILDYIDSIYSSKYENKIGYISEVIKFFDRLAEAVESTNNILVITIAAEKKGPGEIITQTRYRYIREFVKDLLDALLRVAGNIYAPVSSQAELFNVLKKRLFKEIRIGDAEGELRNLYKIYREYSNVFGDTHHLEAQIKETYPFHPSYLVILREIAERVTGNRTRFVMRVSRILVRKLFENIDNPVLIMPWHIDPFGLGIEGLFFMREYSDYQNIYLNEIDVIDKKYTNPELKPKLIKAILRTIFLSTYPYDSLTVKSVFPTSKDIARMVYEPSFFARNNYKPVDILDALSTIRISGLIKFLHYDESSDRYWYSRIASIKEWIQKEAERLLEENRTELENKLVNNVRKLMASRLIEIIDKKTSKSRYVQEPFRYAEIFDNEHMYAYKRVSEAEIPDNDSYKLVAILCNEPDKIRELIYKHQGNDRTYANTVIVATVSTIDKVEALLNYQAHLDAVETIMRKIDELYGSYAKEIRDIERTMANTQKQIYESLLLTSILSFYDLVYYPTVSDSERTIGKAYATSSDKSISERIVSTLSSPSIGKILRSINFEALRTYLAKIGLEIKPDNPIAVNSIISAFKTRPELPMVKEDRIFDALKEGVMNLDIALIDEFNRRYFKKIYSYDDITSFSGRDRGEAPTKIRESFIVVHWRDALRMLLEEIKKDINENNGLSVNGGIQRIEYYVVYGDNKYPIQDIEKHPNWEDILRYGFIVKREQVIKQGILLNVSSTYIELSPNQKARINIEIKPLGGYKGEVEISIPDDLIIEHGPLKGRPPFNTWIIINGSRIGEPRSITITAIDDNGNVYEKSIVIRLKRRVILVEKPGTIMEKDKLLYIEGEINDRNIMDILDFVNKLQEHLNSDEEKKMIISEINISIVSKDMGRSSIAFYQADPSIVSYVISELLDVMGTNTKVLGKLRIEFREEITISSTLKRVLNDAIKNTGLKVAVERVEK